MNIWDFIGIFGGHIFWIGFSVLLLLVYPFLKRKQKKKIEPLVWALVPIILLTYFFVYVMKIYFHIPRPCTGYEFCPSSYSFPSAHAAIMFAVFNFLLLWYRKKKTLILGFLFLALLVSYSRIVLKVHRIEDVIAGALVGCVISTLYYLFYSRIFKRGDNYLLRKTIHLSGILMILIYLYFPKYIPTLLLTFLTVVFFISELLRLKGIKLPFIGELTQKAIKPSEKNKIALEPIAYFVSILLLLFTPFKNFYAGIICLTLGDSLAGLIGKRLGTSKKSLIGSISFLLFTFFPLTLIFPVWKSFLISSITSLMEFLVRDESENLVIALSASFLAFI